MTENPIIPSPPGPSQPPSLANSTTTPENVADPLGEIDCICEISDDDGFTICCDKCDKWQHLVCVQLTKDSVPGEYYCPRCFPRPLDVQKAKAIQRQRRDEEQAKRSHKKKRPASTSHKRKELTNGSNGITSTKVLSAEKAGVQGLVKSASPGGMQQTSTRKRAHRAPTQTNNSLGSNTSVHHTTILLNNVPGANASPGSPNAPFSSRNGETESDTDLEKPAKYLRDGFTDLGNSPNKYASADVQGLVQSLVMTPSNPDSTTSFETQAYSRPDLLLLGLPKASARALPGSSDPRSEHSRRRLLLDVDCSDGDLIAIYKGEIGYQDSYKKDGANQYSAYYHPKPYVLFHPNLPVYVDARQYGTEARFVRWSCRPNLALKTIVIDHSEICFGLFANQSLKLGTELTVSWDWSGVAESFHSEGFDVNLLSTNRLTELAIWMHRLVLRMGDCACSGGKDCLLNQVERMAGVDPNLGKAPSLNGNSHKQRKAAVPVEAVASTIPKQPSPEQQTFPLKKEEDENRSVSPPASQSKPRSRDLTPSTLPDMAVEMGEMTGREARKFKEVLSRIEKQQQEEQQPPSSKRRKRNSTVSLTALPSPGTEPKDGMKGAETSKRHKLPANQRSPYSPPATTPGSSHVSGEYTVADASVGRRASGSPISSDEKRNYQTSSLSPIGQGLEAPKRNFKTIVKPPRLQYQDRAIQTDNDEEVPWWSPSAKSTPPRAPRLPLRKRLMQSLLRDREEAAAIASEDKKRKHDAVSDEAETTLSSKVPKFSSGGSVRVGNSIPAESKRSPDPPPIAITSPTPFACSPSAQAPTVQEPTASAPDPNIIKPPPPPRPPGSPLPGPSLANLFPPDPEKSPPLPQPSGPVVTAGQSPDQPRNSTRQDRPHVNGFRNANLQIHPPPSSGAPNGPPAPLSGSQSSAASSVTVQSPLSIVPSFANPSVSALNNFMIQPSPTRTKKLSLQDYGKRKHKAEAAEKSEDKTATKPAIEAPASWTNATKPAAVVQEAQSTAEPSPGVLPTVSSHSLDVNSTKMVTGIARPPPTPRDQRAASPWNVR